MGCVYFKKHINDSLQKPKIYLIISETDSIVTPQVYNNLQDSQVAQHIFPAINRNCNEEALHSFLSKKIFGVHKC